MQFSMSHIERILKLKSNHLNLSSIYNPVDQILFRIRIWNLALNVCLKFVLLVFQDAAQRSRFKRIEGTNRLKDEHDQLRIMFQEAKSELGTYAKSYLPFQSIWLQNLSELSSIYCYVQLYVLSIELVIFLFLEIKITNDPHII